MKKTCPRCSTIINLDQPLCATCTTKDNQRRGAKSDKHGIRTPGWTRFRHTVLSRDHYRCQHPGCTATTQLTLHYKPGGIHTRNPNDYTTLCLHHHGTIDAPRTAPTLKL